MSSIFEMNSKQICPVCLDSHAKHVRCSYELLVNYVHTYRLENNKLRENLKEAISTAQAFQNIIKSIEPELSRLVAIELLYKKMSEENNGSEKLPAETQERQLPLI